MAIDGALVQRLHRKANAARWSLDLAVFADALDRSVAKSLPPASNPGAQRTYLESLHLEDLALACACAHGHDGAWEHFIHEFRPALYRAADALEPHGGARELADALYGELFGVRERDGERQSLFRYYHGRSALVTWLRAVLSQRFVDRHRSRRNTEPLPDDESAAPLPAAHAEPNPDRERARQLMTRTLGDAVSALPPRDRLRLACYYAQELTLAQTGKLLGEHEATVSRQLTRTRKAIREDVERRLRDEHQLSPAAIAEAFDSVLADAGPMDVAELLRPEARKESALERSR